MTDPPSLVLVLPFTRPDAAELDAVLGESLARTLSRRLEASGRRVVPIDAAVRMCRALGIDVSGGMLAEPDEAQGADAAAEARADDDVVPVPVHGTQSTPSVAKGASES